MTGKSPAPVSLPDTMIEILHEDDHESDPHCLEKRVYYKVISGKTYSMFREMALNYYSRKVYILPYQPIYVRNGSIKRQDNGCVQFSTIQ